MEKAVAGKTTVGRFEKEILLEGDNLNNLDEILKQWTEKVEIYVKRPVGRPGKQPVIKYVSFQYRAAAQVPFLS